MRQPLIDPRLFRDRTFTTAVAIGFVFNFCLYGSSSAWRSVSLDCADWNALDTGLALLPMTVVTAAMALLAGDSFPGSASGGSSSRGSRRERSAQRSSP